MTINTIKRLAGRFDAICRKIGSESILLALTCWSTAEAEPCVSLHLKGQLGNQMFQIATAYAHAKRVGYEFTAPDLTRQKHNNIPENRRRIFAHVPCWPCAENGICCEQQDFRYNPLPAWPDMVLDGYFQSERYFSDYREEILELFAFKAGHWESLLKQYPELSHPCTVGVQVRIPYHPTLDNPGFHQLFGRDYFEQAFRTLPQDALYVVVSNHVGAAKNLLRGLDLNFLFLSRTDRFDDLLILSKCDHIVSSNSSFGWWGAWLGDRPGRRCIFPMPWLVHLPHREDVPDLLPDRWETIDCPEALIKWNPAEGCSLDEPADGLFK
ncbi:MAG: alpha-1,2-fucosyltransferase [Chlamydiia bacterium]